MYIQGIGNQEKNIFGKSFICINFICACFRIWFQIIQIYHTVDKY